jgi:Na+/H+ antiporter NhaC
VTPRAWRAVLPLVAFIGVTLLEIFRAGGAFAPGADLGSVEAITKVLETGSGSLPLLKGSIVGLLVAVVGALTAGQSGSILTAGWRTLRSMGVAFGILYFAWMIGAICATLRTAPYLTALLGDSLDPHVLPTLLLLLAGFVAFATGSSWSTMSILLPLVVGLSYQLGVGLDLGPTAQESGRTLMVMSIAAVLSGAIFGDHCSPISDTTVMSSIASAADHIDHVRTQMPYALLVMTVAVVCGYLPCTYFGLSPWLALLAGAGVLAALLFWLGRRVDAAP